MDAKSTSNNADSTPISVLREADDRASIEESGWIDRRTSGALANVQAALQRRKAIAVAGIALATLAVAGLISFLGSSHGARQSLLFNRSLGDESQSSILALANDPEISDLAAEAGGLSAGDIQIPGVLFGSRTLDVSAISPYPLIAMRAVEVAVDLIGIRSSIGLTPNGPVASPARRWNARRLALLLPAALLGLLSAGLVAWRLASAAEPIRDAAELSAIMGVRLMTQLRLDLRRLSQPKRKLVLLFDECQSLSIEALEQIRLLGNLRTSNRNSLEIVVAGSAELDL